MRLRALRCRNVRPADSIHQCFNSELNCVAIKPRDVLSYVFVRRMDDKLHLVLY